MLGSLTGRLLGLPRRCPDDEARAMNAHTVEMCANPFWHAREPIWRLERPFLNRSTRDERPFLNRGARDERPFLNHGACDERVNRRTEHGEHPTYQIKYF